MNLRKRMYIFGLDFVLAAGLALLFADGVRGCAHGCQRVVDPMSQLVLTVPLVWRSCSCEVGQPCVQRS